MHASFSMLEGRENRLVISTKKKAGKKGQRQKQSDALENYIQSCTKTNDYSDNPTSSLIICCLCCKILCWIVSSLSMEDFKSLKHLGETLKEHKISKKSFAGPTITARNKSKVKVL